MKAYRNFIAKSTRKVINNLEIIETHSLFQGIEKAANDIAKDIFK